jgi:hypothetical protein
MQKYNLKEFRVLTLSSLCLFLITLTSCAMVGPRSISKGRSDYNESINKTEDEQMLLSIVKERYGETSSLLQVTGVAANIRFKSSVGVDVGFGPTNNYDGNLVPLNAGVAYEENPTITYAPVQGETYIKQLMSPLPLNLVVLNIRAGTSSARLFTMMTNRINGMRNPDFHYSPEVKPDTRFQSFIELGEKLRLAGVLDILADQNKDVPFVVLISDYAPKYSKIVREYLDLLGLSMPSDSSKTIVLPVYFTINGGDLDGISISTRSTFDLIEILKASIEIPQDHVNAGLAIKYPAPGLVGKDLHIYSSEEKPDSTIVAVKHRGYWFYIDDTDMGTKLFYRMIRILWSVSIAASSDQNVAPVLTIPVSQ